MEDNKELLNENLDNAEKNNDNSQANINLNVIYIDHENYDADKYADRIEETRSTFYQEYKKSRRISNIATAIVVVLVMAAIILLANGKSNILFTILGAVFGGIAVVGMIVFYLVTRKKMPDKASTFGKDITYLINQRMYDDPKLSQVECYPKEQILLADIVSDNVYTNIGRMPSRNIIKARYENHSFSCADLACYPANNKEKTPYFVGKYITMQNDLHFEGRYILVTKRKENPLDLPNSISDLSVLFEDETHVIYGPEGGKYNEDLGREFVSRIGRFELKDALLNVNAVVWAGHTALYLSYGDEVMMIPIEKSYDIQANEQFRSNLHEALSDMVKLLK